MKLILLIGLLMLPIQNFGIKLSQAALSIVDSGVQYDGTYRTIAYPNGDVPAKIGVCSDVVIRAYRKLGFDLQRLVHDDMKAHFSKYPKRWGLKAPDTNIDHRRVLNLEVFFERMGQKLTLSSNDQDYKPGDIVTWLIDDKLPHIGIVTNRKTADGKRYKIVHNVGDGQVLEDCLHSYTITGHYRYWPN